VEAVHACVGSPLEPEKPQRRVVNVVWGGVALEELLDEAQVEPEAAFAWSYGLDYGDFFGTTSESYLKDLPLRRVAAGDVLVAYEVNGQPLPIENGFPARLVVPGFYGTNSVKWLYRMTLAPGRADGPFVTTFHNDREPASDGAGVRLRPAWDTAPESAIVHPGPGAQARVGEPLELFGWAWAATGVKTVEVSVDDGDSWVVAQLAPRNGWAWQKFQHVWRPTSAGLAGLLSRATDSTGAQQPRSGARNEVYRVEAAVTGTPSPCARLPTS
jgi:DMSO/TMAO reductase YedYZ molybdopterin-dependent catalytic subunit